MISHPLQYILTGLTIGCIYALIALGFNIIYNVTEVINFAQGEFAVWGALTMVLLIEHLKIPLVLNFFLSVSLVSFIGSLIYLVAIKPMRRPSVLTMIVVTIALSIILKGGAMFIWGKDPFALEPFTSGPPFRLFGASVLLQSLWVLGITFALVIALSLYFQKTIWGKAMSACADNPLAAGLVGIDVNKMVLASFALSAALGAIGGIIITPITLMEYDRGAMLALKGFGASVMGGLGSFYGAILAGFCLGLLESLATGYLSSSYKDGIALFILLLVLFFKPSGLLGATRVVTKE
ncbi:MAG: branched-chain amino acid ABC transporter permease [Deltaproteobacteria bacterium]|nr:branched-chain amino acid ABC transporter permease [Deltaproteobacteria bacterium]